MALSTGNGSTLYDLNRNTRRKTNTHAAKIIQSLQSRTKWKGSLALYSEKSKRRSNTPQGTGTEMQKTNFELHLFSSPTG